MLFYDWNMVSKVSGGSSEQILLIIRSMMFRPKSFADPIYPYRNKSFEGNSFLKNPLELLNYSFKHGKKKTAEYIGLASFRNYEQYRLTRDLTLDFDLSPLNKQQIEDNNLLDLSGDKIHFLYEEK